jgi:hypothetical protein
MLPTHASHPLTSLRERSSSAVRVSTRPSSEPKPASGDALARVDASFPRSLRVPRPKKRPRSAGQRAMVGGWTITRAIWLGCEKEAGL